jgi:hypothetical protein
MSIPKSYPGVFVIEAGEYDAKPKAHLLEPAVAIPPDGFVESQTATVAAGCFVLLSPAPTRQPDGRCRQKCNCRKQEVVPGYMGTEVCKIYNAKDYVRHGKRHSQRYQNKGSHSSHPICPQTSQRLWNPGT